jgi:hypothetical protein
VAGKYKGLQTTCPDPNCSWLIIGLTCKLSTLPCFLCIYDVLNQQLWSGETERSTMPGTSAFTFSSSRVTCHVPLPHFGMLCSIRSNLQFFRFPPLRVPNSRMVTCIRACSPLLLQPYYHCVFGKGSAGSRTPQFQLLVLSECSSCSSRPGDEGKQMWP